MKCTMHIGLNTTTDFHRLNKIQLNCQSSVATVHLVCHISETCYV